MSAGSLQLPAGCVIWGVAWGTTGVVVPPPGAGAALARSGTTSPGGPRVGNGPRGAGRGGPVGAALGGQGGTGESPAGSAGGRRIWGTSAAPPQSAPGLAPVRQARVRSPSAAPRPRPRPAGCCGRSSCSQTGLEEAKRAGDGGCGTARAGQGGCGACRVPGSVTAASVTPKTTRCPVRTPQQPTLAIFPGDRVTHATG